MSCVLFPHVAQHQESVATSALPATAAADAGKDQDLLPTTVDPGKKQPTGFPHEFRYVRAVAEMKK